jgi:hypothetical protein
MELAVDGPDRRTANTLSATPEEWTIIRRLLGHRFGVLVGNQCL